MCFRERTVKFLVPRSFQTKENSLSFALFTVPVVRSTKFSLCAVHVYNIQHRLRLDQNADIQGRGLVGLGLLYRAV